MLAHVPPNSPLRRRTCEEHTYHLDGQALRVTLHEPAPAGDVPEALLHDLWQHQQFDRAALATTAGEALHVLAPGRPNAHGGPDFHAARLRIGPRTWRGDVELHVRSAAWLEHGHHRDARYNSTVLHVSLHADDRTGRLRRADGTLLPELVLAPHLRTPLRRLLHAFRTRAGEDALPCAGQWEHVPAATKRTWVRRLARERLEAKKEHLVKRYFAHPNVEALLHERLFAGLGYAPNAEAMTLLAERLPLSLTRTVADPLDLEALHLGASGLIPEPEALLDADRATADYAMTLRRRFERLRAAHDVPPMEPAQWQFFRLRPANFPPLRIAQAAALLRPGALLHNDPLGQLLHALRGGHAKRRLRRLLAARPGAFWEEHVRLERASAPRSPAVGRGRVDTLLVNAVAPVLLLYAEHQGTPGLAEHVARLLRSLPAGADRVTRRFRRMGFTPENAFEAQGLHQLYRTRCTQGGCLRCAVGRSVLGMEDGCSAP